MLHALLTLLFALQPMSPVIEDRVDVIELNHFYGDDAKPVFDQFIFWSWSDAACRFDVVAWRMSRRGSVPKKTKDGWQLSFMDGESLRSVRAGSIRETWDQGIDVEIAERDILPTGDRRDLGARP